MHRRPPGSTTARETLPARATPGLPDFSLHSAGHRPPNPLPAHSAGGRRTSAHSAPTCLRRLVTREHLAPGADRRPPPNPAPPPPVRILHQRPAPLREARGQPGTRRNHAPFARTGPANWRVSLGPPRPGRGPKLDSAQTVQVGCALTEGAGWARVGAGRKERPFGGGTRRARVGDSGGLSPDNSGDGLRSS